MNSFIRTTLKQILWILAVICLLLIIGCGDAAGDFLSGCNSGKLDKSYPQSEVLNCHLNIQNGMDIEGAGQSTVGVRFAGNGQALFTLSSGLQKWDPATGDELPFCPFQENPNCHGAFYERLFFSTENEVIAVQYSGQIYAGGVKSDTALFSSALEPGEGPYYVRTDYIPGWDSFVVYNDKTIEFYNRETGELMSTQEEPLGIELIVGSQNSYATVLQNNLILVLPTRLDREGALLQGHQARIASAVYSPDGSRLASIDVDGVLMMWHTESGELLHQVELDVSHLEQAGFILSPPEIDISTDNQLLVVNRHRGFLTFVSMNSGEILAETEMSRSILDLDISPDRSMLAIAYPAKQSVRTVNDRPLSERNEPGYRLAERDVEVINRGPAVLIDISGLNP